MKFNTLKYINNIASKIIHKTYNIYYPVTKAKNNVNKVMIRLVSYNIDMNIVINTATRLGDIISYFKEESNDLRCDIMCIRGINNFATYYKLFNVFNKEYGENIHIVPNYYNSVNVHGVKKKIPLNENNHDYNKKKIQNIIISRYPILSSIFAELDDDIVIDDILGINTIIGANIIINNNIITIYNTTLCADVNYANITNSYARQQEIISLFNTINTNNNNLRNNFNKKYILSEIQILTGTLNITIPEYQTLLSKYNWFDVVKYFSHGSSSGSSSESDFSSIIENDYLFIIKNKRKQNKPIKQDIKNIIKYLYTKYNFYIVTSYRKDNYFGSEYLSSPSIEIIFLINNKRKT